MPYNNHYFGEIPPQSASTRFSRPPESSWASFALGVVGERVRSRYRTKKNQPPLVCAIGTPQWVRFRLLSRVSPQSIQVPSPLHPVVSNRSPDAQTVPFALHPVVRYASPEAERVPLPIWLEIPRTHRESGWECLPIPGLLICGFGKPFQCRKFDRKARDLRARAKGLTSGACH